MTDVTHALTRMTIFAKVFRTLKFIAGVILRYFCMMTAIMSVWV